MVVHARSSWSRYLCHNRDAATQKVLTIESIHSNLNVRLTFIVGEKKTELQPCPLGWPGRVEARRPAHSLSMHPRLASLLWQSAGFSERV